MTYITVKEASEKWNISTRRVCVLCSNGQVPGAVKKSKVWMIPSGAKKPEDGRKNEQSSEGRPERLFLNPTYFALNGIQFPSADERIICEAQEFYLRGDFDKALEEIHKVTDKSDNSRCFSVAILLRTLFLASRGRKDDYQASIQDIIRLTENSDRFGSVAALYRLYMGIRDNSLTLSILSEEDYPEIMPIFSLINAKQCINEMIHGNGGVDVLNLEIICRELEEKNCPVISAYYHLYLAVYYNAMSEGEYYEAHIKKALQILLPRKWYTPIAEYSTTIDLTFIKEMDEEAYKNIEALSKEVLANYIKVGAIANVYSGPRMDVATSVKIGFKIIQGKSNAVIADELGISQYKVTQHIDDMLTVLGASTRKEIRERLLAAFYV